MSNAKDAFACTEIGVFTPAEARRFQTRLAALALKAKSSTREVQESSSHMVLIPPAESRQAAQKRIAELRDAGIADFYLMQENSAQRWGISLGIFRSEEAARSHLDVLRSKGVRDAQLLDYKMPMSRLAFQLRGLDARAMGEVEKLLAQFPRQEMRNCA